MNNMQGMYIRKVFMKPRGKSMKDEMIEDKPKRKNRRNYKKKAANQKVGKFSSES